MARRSAWAVWACATAVLSCHSATACGIFGWDPIGICSGADSVADELDKLPDKVRQAAQEVLDHLFGDLLPPMLDKFTAAAKELEDRAEQDFERAVNATRAQLEQLARTVVTLAEELASNVTKDVEQIVKQIEQETLAGVEKVISDIGNLVNDVLHELEMDGKELFCAAEGFFDKLQQTFASLFAKQDCECVQAMLVANPGMKQDCQCSSCVHVGGFYPQCPCNPWGIPFGESWYDRGKYDFVSCHLRKVIDWENWTVDQIVSQLAIVQQVALSFRCSEDWRPGSTVNRQYFSDEYTNVSYSILVLQGGSSRLKHPERERHVPRRQRASPSLPSTVGSAPADPGRCAGRTAAECIGEAVAALMPARAEFETYLKELQMFVSDCPQGWVEVNSSKGFLLTGRPEGGTAGTQVNRPLDATERGRVPPHGHGTFMGDRIHETFVTDGPAGPRGFFGLEGQGFADQVGIAVADAGDDLYPLLYVAVCQRAPPAILVNGATATTNIGPEAGPCVGKSLELCLSEAQASLAAAKLDFGTYVTAHSGPHHFAELRMFASDCPQGWMEHYMGMGSILTGRPDGVPAGWQVNRKFNVSERGRVPLHGHSLKVNNLSTVPSIPWTLINDQHMQPLDEGSGGLPFLRAAPNSHHDTVFLNVSIAGDDDPYPLLQVAVCRPSQVAAAGVATKAGPDPGSCAGMTVEECVVETLAGLAAVKLEFERYFNAQPGPHQAELRIFPEECPRGWVEADSSKGFLLMGRPDGGPAGRQLNRPLNATERGRVPQHTHDLRIAYIGPYYPGWGPYIYSGFDDDAFEEKMSFSGCEGPHCTRVGFSVVQQVVSVADAGDDFYPLLYVVVCQGPPPPTAAVGTGATASASVVQI